MGAFYFHLVQFDAPSGGVGAGRLSVVALLMLQHLIAE